MINDFKDIDKLSPGDFEIFVKELLEASGWSDATITKVGSEYRYGDGGVDIFAYKNKRKFAVEVKHRDFNKPITVDALTQLHTGAELANVENMILVTNSHFTSEVHARALKLGIELIDRSGLKDLYERHFTEIARDIKPRVYQVSIINECLEKYNNGVNRFLIEMATGLGKTYTVALLIREVMRRSSSKLKVLFITHRIEILMQSVTSFKNVFGIGNYSFSGCFSGSVPENTDFTFASFDTLFGKLNDLNKFKYDLIIIDEAHHAPAKTYSEVVKYFQPKLLIGLTATPYRMDDKNVFSFFGGKEGHVGSYTLAWALKHGYLAFPKYIVLLDDLNQEKLNQIGNGISINDLDKNLFLHKRDDEVIKIIDDTITEKNICNPKAIVFCQSINHIYHLIFFFPIGTATMVHSKMTDLERRDNIREFREGRYKYILVCDLFNEGIDIPETNLLIFMRYTGSRTIWLQQLGRGLRKTRNKDYVYVLDFVGSLERLNEIKELVKSIQDVKRNQLYLNPDTHPKSIIHDESISVTYDKSAAQVLRLINELQYKLQTRERLIDKLRDYVELNQSVPDINNIENALTDVSTDQIATVFDSYYNFITISTPNYLNKKKFENSINNYIKTFLSREGIKPTLRAISLNTKFDNLLMYNESDILDILGKYTCEDNEDIIKSSITQNNFKRKNIDKTEEDNNVDMSPLRMSIINRYLNKIHSIEDIKKLSEKDISNIRNEFVSVFQFINELKRRRDG